MIVNEIQVKSIMTKSALPVSDFAVNPYVGCPHACKYCYASFMKRFTKHSEPWGDFVDVKFWPSIKNPTQYDGKEVFFSSVTDPYNPLEEKYCRTRTALEELKGSKIKLSISTKSDLILRDIDLIKSFQDAIVSFSLNTLDDDFRSDMDNGASVERRLNAMKILHDNGIRTTCFISPIFPGITDIPKLIERVKNQCNLIWLENLNLRGSYKATILDYINQKHPELVQLYNEIYTKKSRSYWESLDSDIRLLAATEGFEYVRNESIRRRDFNAPPVIVNYFYHEEIRK